MEKIAALIDFTPTTQVVVDFAENVAKQKNAQVALVTIIDKGDEKRLAEVKQQVIPYCKQLTAAGVNCNIEVHEGSFMSVISSVLDKLHVSLAIIGTHGKRGLRQNLFGSHILRLVKSLRIPSLVVQDSSTWPAGGFKNVFFPIAAHSQFTMKIDQTEGLIDKNGKVSLYAIYKTDNLDNELKNNIKVCQEEFEKRSINYELIEEDVNMYSVGYSRQSLEYVANHEADLISIMAQVSKSNKFFGNADKENMILNPIGVPVLCCNDGEDHF